MEGSNRTSKTERVKMKKILWVDCESTGLDSKLNDIIQLAMMIEIDGEIKEKHNFFMQPFSYDNISMEALKINGRTIEEIKTFPMPQEVYKQVLAIFDKYINKFDKFDKFSPGGYNVGFDRGFMNEWFIKNGNKFFGSYVDYHLIDPHPVIGLLEYKGILKLENYHLETSCKFFNIEIKAHDAMSDIEATRELTLKIMEHLK